MNISTFGLLRFEEAYSERLWGGNKLRSVLGKNTPEDTTVGEAWLIADHANHESIVAEGPHRGKTLRQLVEADAGALLGTRARLTIHGRFPLLLKLLDSGQALSVQVHPDDANAKRLGEPDVGKTEMWHVLEADPGAELICGLDPAVTPAQLEAAILLGTVEETTARLQATPGTTAFVPAGTVHAVGAGILLAEIQQNSDLTYRIYDWGRTDANGDPRELHVAKALEVTRFGSPHSGATKSLAYSLPDAHCTVLGACRYFAAEAVCLSGQFHCANDGETFHILLVKEGVLEVQTGDDSASLSRGEAVLVPGCAQGFDIRGAGEVLHYYVPDLKRDVVTPLREAGHPAEDIVRLGGAPETSDLAPYA